MVPDAQDFHCVGRLKLETKEVLVLTRSALETYIYIYISGHESLPFKLGSLKNCFQWLSWSQRHHSFQQQSYFQTFLKPCSHDLSDWSERTKEATFAWICEVLSTSLQSLLHWNWGELRTVTTSLWICTWIGSEKYEAFWDNLCRAS